MTELKCYRVWFKDGSALEVDAFNKKDAKLRALELAESGDVVVRVEEVGI